MIQPPSVIPSMINSHALILILSQNLLWLRHQPRAERIRAQSNFNLPITMGLWCSESHNLLKAVDRL